MQQNSPSLSTLANPSSKAADVVISLNVEPGSYVSDTALFLHICCKAFVLSPCDSVLQLDFNSSVFGSYGWFKL